MIIGSVSVTDSEGITLGAVRAFVDAALDLEDSVPVFANDVSVTRLTAVASAGPRSPDGPDDETPIPGTCYYCNKAGGRCTDCAVAAGEDVYGADDPVTLDSLTEWERMVLAIVASAPDGKRASAYTVANVVRGKDFKRIDHAALIKRAGATLEFFEDLFLVSVEYERGIAAYSYVLAPRGKAIADELTVLPMGEQYSDSWTERAVCHAAGAVTPLTEVEGRVLDIMFEWAHANPTPRYFKVADLFVRNAGTRLADIRDALHHLEDQFVIHVHEERHTEGTTSPEADHEASFNRHRWELLAIGEKLARARAGIEQRDA